MILRKLILIRFLEIYCKTKELFIQISYKRNLGIMYIDANHLFEISNWLVHFGSLFVRVQIIKSRRFELNSFPAFFRPTRVGFPWQHTFPSFIAFSEFRLACVLVCCPMVHQLVGTMLSRWAVTLGCQQGEVNCIFTGVSKWNRNYSKSKP